MRADRLLSMLHLLQTRGRMTASELAERLEVSARTIYRDLDALSAAGVPVYAERGASGGCVLRPGYRSDLTGLNESEVTSLFAGTAGRVLDGLGLSRALQSALLKLEAALPAARRAEADRVRTRVHIDATAWFESSEPTPYLAVLRDAVFADRPVRITYQRGDGRESTRRIEPLGLVVKGGVWYLVALSTGDARVFRVSRIRDVRASEGHVVRPARFDLGVFWQQSSTSFVARIPQYVVRVRVHTRLVPVLPHVLGERVRDTIAKAGGPVAGWVAMELSFDSSAAACGNLIGLGAGVEVLEPIELRAQLRLQAEEVARRYGNSATDDRPAKRPVARRRQRS